MKKIIELAEKICNQNWVIRNEFIEQMRKELTERHRLEQTPITEEWLEDHGFYEVVNTTTYWVYDDARVAIYKGGGRWNICWTNTPLNSIAQLIDLMEDFYGVKLD